jgi:hypothetical protein
VAAINSTSAQEALSRAFEAFQKTAFRFELLQIYDIEEERAAFRSFIENGPQKACQPDMEDWCAEIAKAKSMGRCYQRVRRVTLPPNDYTRFEILSGYQFSSEAGEEIRIWENDESPISTDGVKVKDFWLFDDSVCFELEYNEAGQFIGVHQIGSPQLPLYRRAKTVLLAASVELKQSTAWNLAWMQA